MKPATLVLDAIRDGANNAHDIAAVTGLREAMVVAVLGALKASGSLGADEPAAACASGKACTGCPVANSCSSTVMLTLSARPAGV